jgi:hypothetical protein
MVRFAPKGSFAPRLADLHGVTCESSNHVLAEEKPGEMVVIRGGEDLGGK